MGFFGQKVSTLVSEDLEGLYGEHFLLLILEGTKQQGDLLIQSLTELPVMDKSSTWIRMKS